MPTPDDQETDPKKTEEKIARLDAVTFDPFAGVGEPGEEVTLSDEEAARRAGADGEEIKRAKKRDKERRKQEEKQRKQEEKQRKKAAKKR